MKNKTKQTNTEKRRELAKTALLSPDKKKAEKAYKEHKKITSKGRGK
jgi:hypothetical protein